MYREYFDLINRNEIVYLDNAATTQRPDGMLESMNEFYRTANANPFRGVYKLSEDCTYIYEYSRISVAGFIGANNNEVIFTRNATESLNLVAHSLSINPGDEILVSIAEHHSNYLPWVNTGAKVVRLDINDDGYVTPDILRNAINSKTKIVCVNQTSNVFGQINDIKALAKIAHDAGAIIVVDGAQSVPHMPINVKDLDVDFLAFSGHKMYGPMGIGVLYGKADLLNEMKPFMFGGEMIDSVHWGEVKYAKIPHKFEAGTVNTAGAIGLASAIEGYKNIGFDYIMDRERELTNMAFEGIMNIPHTHIIGSQKAEEHHGIISFTIDDVHPHDVASIMDEDGICVRAGHHCAQPLMEYLSIGSATRVSFALYNNKEDVDKFLTCLSRVRSNMGY